MIWEYLNVPEVDPEGYYTKLRDSGGNAQIIEHINELGAQHWELVAVHPNVIRTNYFVYVFKRPKQQS